MSQQTINIGTAPNDSTGDTLRASFTKCNQNFTELYGMVAGVAPTLISDTPPSTPGQGTLWWESDTGTLFISYNDGNTTQWVAVGSVGGVSPIVQAVVHRGHIDGLTMAWVSNTSFSVTPGQAADQTAVVAMGLAASITKTNAAWAVGNGNGGLDTGSITAGIWYHVYLIYNSTTGVSDVLFSQQAVSPTMPSGFTYKRRIGSIKTDGSGNFVNFVQVGDTFMWPAPVQDLSAVPGNTSAQLVGLSVPTGIVVSAIMMAIYNHSSAAAIVYVSSPLVADVAPSTTNWTIQVAVANCNFSTLFNVLTNTTGQIRYRVTNTGGGFVVNTLGWIDPRGRNL